MAGGRAGVHVQAGVQERWNGLPRCSVSFSCTPAAAACQRGPAQAPLNASIRLCNLRPKPQCVLTHSVQTLPAFFKKKLPTTGVCDSVVRSSQFVFVFFI